jgi:glycosyltransferase involved in cell wall biosynthesis
VSVSVIVPVRDGERYLEGALRSVLDQAHPELELIVIDDGSTDATPEVIRRMGAGVRAARQPPRGGAAAVNHGVALAGGTFLAFLDADDLWTPGRLATQVAALDGDASLDFVLGHVGHFHSPDLTAEERAAIFCPPAPMPGVARPAMLIRREAYSRVGEADTRWKFGEFIDWHARAVELGLRGLMLPDVVLMRRLHARNSTRQSPEARVDYVRIAREALHRRRGRGSRSRSESL